MLSGGAIAGIVVGSVVGLGLIILIIALSIKSAKKRKLSLPEEVEEKVDYDDKLLLDHRPALGHRKVAKLMHKGSGQAQKEQVYNTEEVSNINKF